jgi:phage gp29-like protein
VQQAAAPKKPGHVPAKAMVIEPMIRTYQDWSPDLIRAAELQADGGSLRLAADLCEWVLRDDRVKAVLDTRTDALLGLPLTFEPGRGGRKSAAVRAIEAGEDWWAAYPEVDVKALQAWGLILGVGIARQSWEMHGDRLIPRLVIHHPRHLRYDWQARSWMLTVLDEAGGSQHEIPIEAGDGTWIIYTPYCGPAGSNRPWSLGAWQALSRWVLLKWQARTDWGNYSERLGSGVWLAMGGDTDKIRKDITADLASLGRNAVLAIPTGFDLKLVESQARTWEAFQRQIETCDNGCAVTLLGQNLTTQNDGGSQAATSEHGRVKLGRTKSDAETLSTCLHDQSLRFWAMFNFGSEDAAPWPCWLTTPVEDLKAKAGTLQMVSQALTSLVTAKAPVDVRALLAQFQIPLLDVPQVVDSPEPGTPDPTPELPAAPVAATPAAPVAPVADPGAS